ncbi:MAG: homocysteine S-methyltransferase [Acidobacteriota bacterium]
MTTTLDSNPLSDRLAGGPLLLDGGLATELENLGADLTGGLYSARCLLDSPDLILKVHRDFLEAGADCLIAASYQASLEGFTARGLSAREAEQALVSSVALARRARRDFLERRGEAPRPLVAASVGPYGAVLADGSEFTGSYGGVGARGLERFHQDRLRLLAESGADLLACETLPSRVEIEVLADLLTARPAACWMSFSCRDGEHLADGTPLEAVAELLRDHPAIVALGVNCVPPSRVAPCLRSLRRAAPSVALLAYPNRGGSYDARTGQWIEETAATSAPSAFAAGAVEWLEAGAQILGGCCCTGPEDIRALRAVLERRASS